MFFVRYDFDFLRLSSWNAISGLFNGNIHIIVLICCNLISKIQLFNPVLFSLFFV
jgi:hypothetical protein